MFADQELVDNYLSHSEKKPSLRMDLLNSSQLHFRVSWNSMFSSVIRVLIVITTLCRAQLCAKIHSTWIGQDTKRQENNLSDRPNFQSLVYLKEVQMSLYLYLQIMSVTIQISKAVSNLVIQLGMALGLSVGLQYSLISVTTKKLGNLQIRGDTVLVAAELHNLKFEVSPVSSNQLVSSFLMIHGNAHVRALVYGMQTFSMEYSLEPGFISINEETEVKLKKLLAPRIVKLKTEIKLIAFPDAGLFRGFYSYN